MSRLRFLPGVQRVAPELSWTGIRSSPAVRLGNTLVVGTLLLSGLFHLGLYAVIDADWEGPISPRKPGLFGISAGLTAWSILWCADVLRQGRGLKPIATSVTWALFLEVILITAQYWRGVPSHFNRSTFLNATIEILMLGLILVATIGIAQMCWISTRSFAVDRTRLLAIRAGLWLLLLSCLLGGIAMACGEINLSHGKSPEIWGQSGILKYPHGAALHAIQLLPVVNWLLTRFTMPHRHSTIARLISAQILFLTQALWQTFQGRSRFDVDLIGRLLLLLAMLFTFASLMPIIRYGLRVQGRRWFKSA